MSAILGIVRHDNRLDYDDDKHQHLICRLILLLHPHLDPLHAMSQLTLLCTKGISEPAIEKLRKFFKTVHYIPDDSPISSEILSSTEILFTGGGKFHPHIKSLDDLPKLKHVQMASAGANGILGSSQMKEYLKELESKGEGEKGRFGLAGASGTHVLSIPNYVVGTVITLYHQLHTQIIAARVSARTCGR